MQDREVGWSHGIRGLIYPSLMSGFLYIQTGELLRPAQVQGDSRHSRTPWGLAGSVVHMSAEMGRRERAQRLRWLTGFHLLHQVDASSGQMGGIQVHEIG